MTDLDSLLHSHITETIETTMEMVRVPRTIYEAVLNTIEVLLHLTSDLILTTRPLVEVLLLPTTATRS